MTASRSSANFLISMEMQSDIDPVLNAAWLQSFEKSNGRRPRCLHVGNIANNAYKSAKVLNSIGIETDVLCYNYHHIMGSPEWEDAEFDFQNEDHFRPVWYSKDLKGFSRPEWFIQGDLTTCASFIDAKHSGRPFLTRYYWFLLCLQNRVAFSNLTFLNPIRTVLDPALFSLAKSLPVRAFKWAQLIAQRKIAPDDLAARAQKKLNSLASNGLVKRLVLGFVHLYGRYYSQVRRQSDLAKADELCDLFANTFPDRPDKLELNDVLAYEPLIADFSRIFRHYDFVQCYSTDPIFALMSHKKPYMAFEHGTLRTFTLEPSPLNRLTSLAYNQADHVYITNGDCLEYAKKIGVTRFTPMIHPIDSEKIKALQPIERPPEWGSKKVFICPLRHDWAIKGTDRYIRALPALKAMLGNSFLVLFTKWGLELEQSQLLAKQLEVEDVIQWIEPLPKTSLLRTFKACDLVLDQLALPCFGATAPEALACNSPVIMSYHHSSVAWIIDEPAPILPAHSVEDIVRQALLAIDPEWKARFQVASALWVAKHHSDRRVAISYLNSYARVLGYRSDSKNHHKAAPSEGLSESNL